VPDETYLDLGALYGPPTPAPPPPRYRPDADPLHITALETLERLEKGYLILPTAYQARDEVNAVIALLREAVELKHGEVTK